MIETNHIHHQVSDYVLGLLTAVEHRHVELHAATCAECRQAIRQQSRIGKVVRASVVQISAPDRRRLQQLMPPVPSRRYMRWRLAWQRQLAPACLGLLILLGTWGLWQANHSSSMTKSENEFMVATATMTDIPTATLAQTEVSHSGLQLSQSATIVPAQPNAVVTPVPNPTPIVAATQALDE